MNTSGRSASPNKRSTAPQPGQQKKSFASFKSMKKDKQKHAASDAIMNAESDLNGTDQIRSDV